MQTDPIADFLTSIRNAERARKKEVLVPYSRMKSDIAHVLKDQGYVSEVEMVSEAKKKPQLKMKLKGAILKIQRQSKPGLRRYVQADEIPDVLRGMGISVVSTSQGVMAGHEAKKRRLGGELLLIVS
jgi:small subunit ribosomal protein S8